MEGGVWGVAGDSWSWDSASARISHVVSCSQPFSPLDWEAPEHKDQVCLAHLYVHSPWSTCDAQSD